MAQNTSESDHLRKDLKGELKDLFWCGKSQPVIGGSRGAVRRAKHGAKKSPGRTGKSPASAPRRSI
jgi:hypothetical protein